MRLVPVAVIVLGATALKLWIALTTYGTSDVWLWEQFLAGMREGGALHLYHTDENFNHPPFMTHVLLVIGAVADRSGIPFPFWLRLPAIVADVVIVVLVALLVARRAVPPLAGRAGLLSLALLAAAPASIMVSGFHGNTDPVVMAFVLLGVVLWETRRRSVRGAVLAGAALGMALNVKAVPIIFFPAFLLSLGMWYSLPFLAAAGSVVVLGSMPYIVQDPAILAQKVLGYGSYYGHWGLSRLFSDLAPGGGLVAQLDAAFREHGRYLAVGLPALAVAAAHARHLLAGGWLPTLYVQCGLAVACFLAVSPGFGPQYLAWIVPWVPGAGAAAGAALHAATGVFLFNVYDYWSGEFPWHFADARPFEFEWWHRPIVNLEVVAWTSVVLVAGALLGLSLQQYGDRRRDAGTVGRK